MDVMNHGEEFTSCEKYALKMGGQIPENTNA